MRNTDTSGFSLIEALVSLTIVSLIGIMLVMIFSIGSKSIVKSRETAAIALKRMAIDSGIRNSIEKVRIPYWETDFDFSVSATAITLSWYQGNKETVSLKLPSGISDVRYELIYVKDGIPAGCRIYYTLSDTEYYTAATFATMAPGALKL